VRYLQLLLSASFSLTYTSRRSAPGRLRRRLRPQAVNQTTGANRRQYADENRSTGPNSRNSAQSALAGLPDRSDAHTAQLARSHRARPRRKPTPGSRHSWLLEDEAQGATYWIAASNGHLDILKKYNFTSSAHASSSILTPPAAIPHAAKKPSAISKHTKKFARRIRRRHGFPAQFTIPTPGPPPPNRPNPPRPICRSKTRPDRHDWTANVVKELKANARRPTWSPSATRLPAACSSPTDGPTTSTISPSLPTQLHRRARTGCQHPLALHHHLGRTIMSCARGSRIFSPANRIRHRRH